MSGARREATDETHFVSVVDNVNAYKVEGHRHTAELEQELPADFSFVAHLLPIDQGSWRAATRGRRSRSRRRGGRALREAYRHEPFVDVLDYPPRTRDVRDTNRATVQVAVVNERVLAFCAIDNLWKGAAGQAVQDLNLMLGLPETEGCSEQRDDVLPLALLIEAPAHVTELDPHALPPGSAPPARPPGSSRTGSTWACWPRTPGHGLRRALHLERPGRRPGDRVAAGGPRAAARGGRQLGRLERRRRPARPGHRARDAGGRGRRGARRGARRRSAWRPPA